MSQQYTNQFHEAEIAVQKKVGVAERVAPASQYIREFMPDQHREFFANLPFIILGVVDRQGCPWAVPVFGTNGFISSPSATTLKLNTLPQLKGVLDLDLSVGQKIGTVGVEVQTRRRNRMNGTISDIDDKGLTISVELSFGNCPQYIQKRYIYDVEETKHNNDSYSTEISKNLSARSKSLIENADTFFIASRTKQFTEDKRTGLDASHRGGKPGFVKVYKNTLLFPDFSGNKFFNTIGNIASDERVGLVFPDFQSTDALFITGRAKIHYEHPALSSIDGAERIIEINVDRSVYVDGFLPMQGEIEEYSSSLSSTGVWSESKNEQYSDFQIVGKQPESATISSIYLSPKTGNSTIDYIPGQFLPLEITIPGQKQPLKRSYTLSRAPRAETYRISVKREEAGLVSKALHDTYGIGSYLRVGKPAGNFTIKNYSHSIVLVSGGVGITPMIAMLEGLIVRANNGEKIPPVWFFHATQNSENHAFQKDLLQWSNQFDWLTVHTVYSQPKDTDELSKTHQAEGRISIETFKNCLPFDQYDFYLCGSQSFMSAIYRGLKNIGVSKNNIYYEFFGEGTLDDEEMVPDVAEKAKVTFTTSKVSEVWKPEDGTLLAFAEKKGLSPSFSCRNGSCGACLCNLKSGSVVYGKQPTYQFKEGEVLICSARPAAGSDTLEIDI
ncbi:hypothetical protein KUL17_25390 [Alteromonas sp. KUL17]|uniref:2Fe-2S iron-sulfur cluster-binding protein n=1 Tax=Alteromonas sp. KUL17 TaxID=2480796 RepID=UPI0010380ED5|nr:pyridoxamine 5'-phosphate oxidase family protein [Alteromonas sp. KUL17]TAP25365.1 2Fe-2S iron-sulfur cluster binding domain-containing protein [Alteromonas sp. KUL17]GEA03642.1 hypothetical protein KUL17_25390 [Alteromonas sp. KUL17]